MVKTLYSILHRSLDLTADLVVFYIKIYINDEFYRLAPLYATVGLTAEMAEIFEHPKVRGALKITPGRNTRLILSLLAATRFYFNHRRTNILNIKNIGLYIFHNLITCYQLYGHQPAR